MSKSGKVSYFARAASNDLILLSYFVNPDPLCQSTPCLSLRTLWKSPLKLICISSMALLVLSSLLNSSRSRFKSNFFRMRSRSKLSFARRAFVSCSSWDSFAFSCSSYSSCDTIWLSSTNRACSFSEFVRSYSSKEVRSRISGCIICDVSSSTLL